MSTAGLNSKSKLNLVSLLLIYGLPALVFIISTFLVFSNSFDAHTEVMAMAITYDLCLTAPLLYLFLIRKKPLPKLTAVPVFILGVVLASYLLPEAHQYHLDIVRGTMVPLVESLVLIYLVVKARKLLKAIRLEKGRTADFMDALRKVTKESLPQKLAGIFVTEVTMFYYAFFSWKKSKVHADQYTYHKKSGTAGLLSVFIFLIIVETFAVHLLLEQWSTVAAWVLTALSIYTIVQIVAIIRSMKRRPIVLTANALYVRYGLLADACIPLSQISEVRKIKKGSPLTAGARKLSPLGELEGYNLVIELKEDMKLNGMYGFKRSFSALFLHVDHPDELLRNINRNH